MTYLLNMMEVLKSEVELKGGKGVDGGKRGKKRNGKRLVDSHGNWRP